MKQDAKLTPFGRTNSSEFGTKNCAEGVRIPWIAVGGRVLSYRFWQKFAEIIVAIKIAPFNRYQTLSKVRRCARINRAPVAESAEH
jgi:hypothetical protein